MTKLRVLVDGNLGGAPNVCCDVLDAADLTEDGSAGKARQCWCPKLAEEGNILHRFVEIFKCDGFVVYAATRRCEILPVCESDYTRDGNEVQAFPKSASSGTIRRKGKLNKGNVVESRPMV